MPTTIADRREFDRETGRWRDWRPDGGDDERLAPIWLVALAFLLMATLSLGGLIFDQDRGVSGGESNSPILLIVSY